VRRIIGGVAILVVVTVAALALRLSQGPIDIASLGPAIEGALQPADGSYRIAVGQTQISWESWREGLRIRANAVSFTRPDGSGIATLPVITARLAVGGLMRGEIALKELTLRSPQLRMTRRDDGRIEIGLEQKERSSAPIMSGLLNALARERREQGPLADLETVRIDGGDLIVDDVDLGREWQAQNVSGSLVRDVRGIEARLSFELAVDSRKVHFAAQAHHRRADGTIDLTLEFRDLAPVMFATARGPLRALAWFDTPFGGRIDLAMRGSGRIEGARFDIKGSQGRLTVPGYYNAPLAIAEFGLAGSISEQGRKLEIVSFRVKTEGPTIETSGTFVGDETDWHYRGSYALSSFPAADIKKYWPEGLKPSARAWVIDNITEGTVEHLGLRLALRKRADKAEPLLLDTVRGDFRFRGLSVRYLKQLPPVTQVDGSATFDDRDLKFKLDNGLTEGIRITGGRVDILGFEKPKEAMEIIAGIEGKLGDILKLLDRKPLGFASALGVNPVVIGADAKATVGVRFKLANDITLDDIDIQAEADLSRFNWRKGVFGLDIADGRFKLTVNKSGLVLWGESRLADQAASIRWGESFGPTEGARRTLEIKTRFQAETLASIGLDIRGNMSGAFGADLKITGTDAGRTTIEGSYDFRDTAFVTPGVAIAKPAGMAASGRSLIVLQNQRVVAVPRFELDSPVIQASGNATFYPDGVTIRTMELTRFVAGKTNLRAIIEGDRDGTKTARIDGEAFDLGPVLVNRTEGGDVRLPPFRVFARLGRLYFAADRFVSEFGGEAAHDGTRWRRVALQSRVGRGAPLTLTLQQAGHERTLAIATNDAGAALRSLNIADTVIGGDLDIRAKIDDRRPNDWFTGTGQLGNFRVVRAPVMARLMALASLEGLGNLLSSDEGVEFTDVTLPFRFRDGVVDIRDGRAQGSQIGITVTGRLDTRKDVADLGGTIVPFYLLNSIAGQLPVVGKLLIGEKGGGLFAVSFTVAGELAKAKIEVNPLSLLTPGPFRRLFDRSRTPEGNALLEHEAERAGRPPRPATPTPNSAIAPPASPPSNRYEHMGEQR
jgi:hypothetical protein